MAAATFSETKDKQAVLKLYTKDYVGIQDGETETRDSIEKWLSDYESELNKGKQSALYQCRIEPAGSDSRPNGLGYLRLRVSGDQERRTRSAGLGAMHHHSAQGRRNLAHSA
jgi:hypothetical protein